MTGSEIFFSRFVQNCKNIRRTFGKIKKNVSWWKAFIEHPRVTAARKLVWKHGKFLLKHIFSYKDRRAGYFFF